MRAADLLLDLLYPRRCPFCRKLIDGQRRICRDCEKKLPFVPARDQIQHFRHIDACYSPLYYEGMVRESLLHYKFSGAAAYAEVYGELMAKCVDENSVFCDIITWVPLSRKRLRRRGYDQAELLAVQTAAHMGLRCRRLLTKTRNNPAQSGTGSAEKRRKNVMGVYETAEQELVDGKTVLLVDDIVTTGSTLSECASVLKAAGAKKILALTLARHRD